MQIEGTTLVIRVELPEDQNGIRGVTARAFTGLSYSDGSEPRMVDALREAGALAVSLVAALGPDVVGHVGFSEAGSPSDPDWFALGPVSVEPRLQRRGIGTELIRRGLAMLRNRSASGCVLVGDHRYYSRFGFVVTPELTPTGYPSEYFQVLRFSESGLTAPPIFHPAFSITADH